MRLPVSTNAVARIVRLPPSSIFLAEPKNFFGRYKAAGSIPPLNVLPEGGIVKLYARARRVRLSIKIITSRPSSTRRSARSNTSSLILMWFSGSWSNVEYTTSASTVLSMSVTSSGRSSMSKIINSASG